MDLPFCALLRGVYKRAHIAVPAGPPCRVAALTVTSYTPFVTVDGGALETVATALPAPAGAFLTEKVEYPCGTTHVPVNVLESRGGCRETPGRLRVCVSLRRAGAGRRSSGRGWLC